MSEDKAVKRGTLFVYSGCSGVGKGTIMKELLARNEKIKLSVSATTRDPRPGETNGVEYFFDPEMEMTYIRDRRPVKNMFMMERSYAAGWTYRGA